MLAEAVLSLVRFLNALGGWGVVVGMALESAGAPVPSEVVLPYAGYLVWEGRLGMAEAVALATVGQLAGSAGAYALGRYGGRPLIWRYHRYLLLKEGHLRAAEDWFARYGEWAVLVARLLPLVRSVISYPAGWARMPFGRFLVYSTVGVIPFTWALTYAGYQLGQNWGAVRVWFHELDYALAAVAAVLLAALALRALLRSLRRGDGGGRPAAPERT